MSHIEKKEIAEIFLSTSSKGLTYILYSGQNGPIFTFWPKHNIKVKNSQKMWKNSVIYLGFTMLKHFLEKLYLKVHYWVQVIQKEKGPWGFRRSSDATK